VNNFEIIDHTADIRIRVFGADLKGLFRNAGLAIFQISAEKTTSSVSKVKKIKIIQEAFDLEELLVNWLNELLSLSAAKGLVFTELNISKIDEKNLEAEAIAESMENYRINTEIKAATYHELKVVKTAEGWQAELILDV
jgi:SHS2 domain-containing protein